MYKFHFTPTSFKRPEQVFVTGNFVEWEQRIPLEWNNENERFESESVSLPSGLVKYKFIVDDSWQCASDQSTMIEKSEEINNVLVMGPHSFTTGGKVVVVLGKKLLPDGSPLQDLVERVKVAVDIFLSGLEGPDSPDFMIMTGGMVEVQAGRTEAECMRDIALGYKPELRRDQIVLETQATKTIQNGTYVKELLLIRKNVSCVTLVTTEYHMKRSRAIFEFLLRNIEGMTLKCEFAPNAGLISEEALAREKRVEEYMIPRLQQHLQGL